MLTPYDKGKRGAYFLMELAVTMSALFIMISGITHFALMVLETVNYIADTGAARERANQVFSILKLPADFCGYGLQKSVSLYKETFGDVNNFEPFSWDGPISVVDSALPSILRKNGTCRIAYGIPSSSAYIGMEASVSDDVFDLLTSGNPSLLEKASYDDPLTPKNWILVGSMLPNRRPMWLSKKIEDFAPYKKLTLKWVRPLSGGSGISVHKNDALVYLSAIQCEVKQTGDDYTFYVKNYRGGGNQPREKGVIDVRFELDSGGKLIKVMLLVRGNRRYSDIKTKETPVGWPEKYASDIPVPARHYRLFAFSESFELKNL
jgi:hypothetical protein